MSSLHAKFKAALKRAVPSIDNIPSSRKGAAAYLMGGYVKIFVEKVPSQPTLRLSVSIYKIKIKEFNPLELRFMLTSAKRSILTGRPAVHDYQIVVIDDIPATVVDNYPAFSHHIDQYLDSYWAARSRLIDIKEEYIRRDLKRQKQTKDFLRENRRFSTSNSSDFEREASIRTMSSEGTLTRQQPLIAGHENHRVRSRAQFNRRASTGTMPKRTSLWKANAFVWPMDGDAPDPRKSIPSSSTRAQQSHGAARNQRPTHIKIDKSVSGKNKSSRCLCWWRSEHRRKEPKLTKKLMSQSQRHSNSQYLDRQRSHSSTKATTVPSSGPRKPKATAQRSVPSKLKRKRRIRRSTSWKTPVIRQGEATQNTRSATKDESNPRPTLAQQPQQSSLKSVQKYSEGKDDSPASRRDSSPTSRSQRSVRSVSSHMIQLSQLYTRPTSPRSQRVKVKSKEKSPKKVMKLQPIFADDGDDVDWWGSFESSSSGRRKPVVHARQLSVQ